MSWWLAAQILGGFLAVLDFFKLGDWLEGQLDRFRISVQGELPVDPLLDRRKLVPAFVRDVRAHIKDQWYDKDGPEDAKRNLRRIFLGVFAIIFVMPFITGEINLWGFFVFWIVMPIMLFTMVFAIMIGIDVLERYVIPYGLWLPLHIMNKAPSGVVGSLGLIVFLVSTFTSP